MLPTTERYKRGVNADVRWASAKIVMGLYDVDAAPSATVSTEGEASFSRTKQMCDTITGMSGTWLTLEPGGFPLNGSGVIPPQRDEAPDAQMGFWSEGLSDADGIISVTREIAFSRPVTSIGVTVCFDEPANVYAVDFAITLQSGSTTLNQITVTGNAGARYVAAMPTEKYNRAIINITKWSRPFSRVRISEMLFGIIETLTGDEDITDINILSEIDLTSETVPSREMAVIIQNFSRRFDQWNPAGIYKYLVDAYPMDTYIGLGEKPNEIDEAYCGRDYFYMSEGANGQATARIKTRDKLFQMGSTKYRKGRLARATVYDALVDVFADAGIADYTIDAALKDIVITPAFPEVTHREAVRMLAQAGRACAFIDRSGNPVVRQIAESAPVAEIGEYNAYDWPSPEIDEYFNAVDVAIYNYRDPGGGSSIIAEASIAGSGTREAWVAYRGAAYGAIATATAGTIVYQTPYLHHMHLTLSGGAAEITVSGRLAEKSTSSYLYDQSGDESMLIKSIDNPLVTDNAAATRLAQWRYNLLTQRTLHNVKWRGDPAIEVGDTVSFEDEYGQRRNAITTRHELFYDGTLYQLTQAQGGGQ